MTAFEATQNATPAQEYEKAKAECYVTWQLDGRELIRHPRHHNVTETRPRTRRIRLEWDRDAFPESYLVLVAAEAKQLTDPSSQRLWESDAYFLGRYINSAAKNHALVKSWLEICDGSHQDLCKIDRGDDFRSMRSKSYFGVVDVHQMCLTSLPTGSRYVALSYMWGIGRRYTTTLRNIISHQEPGGLEKILLRLPKVIQDAIHLVRSLGERYLWVDSLCIVQDSAKSWELNSAVMDLVYGNAHLTICAADGDSHQSGLRGLLPERIVRQHDELCAPGVRLMVSRLAETYIESSKWNTRAWTFQERLLSKRCLIFTNDRIYFQCRSAAMSEDIIAEQRTHSWSLELVHSPLKLLDELDSRGFRVYMTCVELYAKRTLGRPKDILAAFRGLTNLLGDRMGSPFLFGLPSSHFDLALLWQPTGPTRIREPLDKMNEQKVRDYGEIIFPTWSWCGWELVEDGTTNCYTGPSIKDCLENVHQFLMEHTWIKWYIRDGHGTLRPVWDGSQATKRLQKVHSQWQGYRDQRSPTKDCYYDSYGRPIPEEIYNKNNESLKRTMPEYPFCVNIADPKASHDSQLPDQRYLQFCTWSALLRLLPQDRMNQSDARPDTAPCLRRYDIADYTGDWCGTILLDSKWGDTHVKESGTEHEFIAISDAKNFTREEKKMWTFYIPQTDEHSEWDLFFVLLLETRLGISRRVGLGKVFKEAFNNSCGPGKTWKEFILE
ncbi:HET-domain-containing protein [Lojkania enalia]|uniref:HET-domain-containing protein n=1 Tax=Lojkania enalia TaxID=147567 RepID=A0A9P4TR01_9PLEO|nr:HET-domain-containing protein [Didymosphaeria enalia]